MQRHLRNVIKNIQHSAEELDRSTVVVTESSAHAQHVASMRSVEQIESMAEGTAKIAERTGQTTAQITNMIVDIQKEIEATISAMEQTLPQVEKGLELADITSYILNEIQVQANDSLSMT